MVSKGESSFRGLSLILKFTHNDLERLAYRQAGIRNELLLSIATKYKKSIAQLVLRWLTQRGVVAIPKSVKKERIRENFNIFDFELTFEDMVAITTLDMKTSSFFDHRDPEIIKWIGSRKLDI